MRVLVCGGRNYSDFDTVCHTLNRVVSQVGDIDTLIHGDASGADSLAKDWAESHHIPTLAYPAEWEKHGRAAGPIRNQRMIDYGKPDIVVAFPGGRGTGDMINRAESAGLFVLKPDCFMNEAELLKKLEPLLAAHR